MYTKSAGERDFSRGLLYFFLVETEDFPGFLPSFLSGISAYEEKNGRLATRLRPTAGHPAYIPMKTNKEKTYLFPGIAYLYLSFPRENRNKRTFFSLYNEINMQ